ncbi:protein YebF [Yersinia sp. 1652 StPb PI]|uniref:protein YebF n=1 Tax=unclassified Yersinia (in: enterobacteria) TaxID=2653513 RepID=UPI00355C596F
MRKTGLALVLITALAGITSGVQAQEPRVAKLPTCPGLNQSQVATQVKRDFLQNRITRWEADKKQLGTDSPVVWISAVDITGQDDVWQVPMTVRGNKGDKTYQVVLDCKAGSITYNGPK